MRPRRLLACLHLPIRLVRLATDPIVDGILWFLRPAVSHVVRLMSEVLRLRLSVPQSTKSSINLNELISLVNRRTSQFVPDFFFGKGSTASDTPVAPRIALWKQAFDYLVTRFPALGSVETGASAFADSVKAYGASLLQRWQQLATHNGPKEQIFAVALGYAAIFFVAIMFMSSGLVINGGVRMVRNVISQQLIVLKVFRTEA